MASLLSLMSSNDWKVRKLSKLVRQINALEAEVGQWREEDFRRKTEEFKAELRAYTEKERAAYEAKREEYLRCKEPEERKQLEEEVAKLDLALKEKEQEYLRRVLPLMFAMVREASVRTIGLRHFDVQLIGGVVLHEGKIAEMKTGEGKTLVATLSLSLNALTGRGVQLVTVNDYLAKRDAEWMGPIYEYLGLSVGYIQHFMESEERRQMYNCDVTYVTNSELGFDYLRDNLVRRREDLVLREYFFAIVDEVDSILVDEARTPLIISGVAAKPTDVYYRVDKVVRPLRREQEYTVDEKAKTAVLTDEGLRKVERGLGVANLSDSANFEIYHFVMNALKAHTLFKRDVDYVVKDGEVIIVDEFTGRLQYGRRWSDGLHQAVEAKEGLRIQRESQTVATITLQNFFRMYYKLAGMTGTAKTEEREFVKIYGVPVVVIPTHRPMIRKDHPDVVYKSEEHKFRGVAREILNCYARQQPALVGTRSIAVSERLSERLNPHYLQFLALCTLTIERLHSRRGEEQGAWWQQILSRFGLANRNGKNGTIASQEDSDEEPIDWDEFHKMREVINTPLEELQVSKVRQIARKLGMDTDVFAPENIRRFAQLVGIREEREEEGEWEDCLLRLEGALRNGIPHNVLNAKHHEQEAKIIAEAGRLGMITVATNMAGRGVDIILGGKPDPENHPEEICNDADCNAYMTHNVQYHEVVKRGGLHIIGTERHESRRIDNQLRGRSGRQGDPGSSRFYVSLQDELWRLYGDRFNNPLLKGWLEEEPIESRMVTKAIQKAQERVEAHNFDTRRHTLRYDDVMNVQRENIYSNRRKILSGADMRANVLEFIQWTTNNLVDAHLSEAVPMEEWNLESFWEAVRYVIPLDAPVGTPMALHDLRGKGREEIKDLLYQRALELYEFKESHLGEELMRQFERDIMLWVIDEKWIDHLANMDYLRDHIGLRGYAQRDPFIEYQREAYGMFQDLLGSIRADVVRWVYHAEPRTERTKTEVSKLEEHHMEITASGEQRTTKKRPVRTGRKVGRNDPCPCGSGRKYKKCCMLKQPEPVA